MEVVEKKPRKMSGNVARQYERTKALILGGMATADAVRKTQMNYSTYYKWREREKQNGGEVATVVHVPTIRKVFKKKTVVPEQTVTQKIALFVGSAEDLMQIARRLGVVS